MEREGRRREGGGREQLDSIDRYRLSGATTQQRRSSATVEMRWLGRTLESSRPRAVGRPSRQERPRWTTGSSTSSSRGKLGKVPSTALERLEILLLSTVEWFQCLTIATGRSLTLSYLVYKTFIVPTLTFSVQENSLYLEPAFECEETEIKWICLLENNQN